jgi:hypothetical protein
MEVSQIGHVHRVTTNGDPDPISAGTVGDAALRGGSSAVVGMAANPHGAHKAGADTSSRMRD